MGAVTHPSTACAACGCAGAQADGLHAIAAAVAADDLDRALDLGLLDAQACAQCDAACRAGVAGAREERRVALAARGRHRARADRLQRREQVRAECRESAARQPAALPPAAAAALERARARAAKP